MVPPKLSDDKDGGIFGYYRTDEGRQFLREVYPIFEASVPFGDKKIASLIADNSYLDQAGETDLTRSALRRWADGQSELWKREPDKSLRVLGRLERHMMDFPPVAEVHEDRAATLQRQSFVAAMGIFFDGTRRSAIPRERAADHKLAGLYREEYCILGVEDNDAVRLSAGSMFYFSDDSGSNRLLIKEFGLRLGGSAHAPVFLNRYSGIGFLTARGDVFRFMTSLSDPSERRIDALRAVVPHPEHGWILPVDEGDRSYAYHSDMIFEGSSKYSVGKVTHKSDGSYSDEYMESLSNKSSFDQRELRRDRLVKVYSRLIKVKDPRYSFVTRNISGTEWDFVL